jgi:hypothetical protein
MDAQQLQLSAFHQFVNIIRNSWSKHFRKKSVPKRKKDHTIYSARLIFGIDPHGGHQ